MEAAKGRNRILGRVGVGLDGRGIPNSSAYQSFRGLSSVQDEGDTTATCVSKVH